MRRCIFFDRDGTLLEERNYLSDPAQVALIPGAAEAVRMARAAGYLAVVLTNQSGVGRGYFRMQDVEAVHRRMEEMLAAEGARLDGIYICPHAPEEDCACRKPRTGLVERAALELGIDLSRSWMIGDKAADIELAANAAMKSVLVMTGYGEASASGVSATILAPDVLAAVRGILAATAAEGAKAPEAPGSEAD